MMVGGLCFRRLYAAKAGLLDGKRPTIPLGGTRTALSEDFEDVTLTKVGSLVVDGNRMTTAGRDGVDRFDAQADCRLILGEDLANAVADQLIYSSFVPTKTRKRLSVATRYRTVRHSQTRAVIQNDGGQYRRADQPFVARAHLWACPRGSWSASFVRVI